MFLCQAARLLLPKAEKCVQFCNYLEDMANPATGSVYWVFVTPQCQFPEANFEKLYFLLGSSVFMKKKLKPKRPSSQHTNKQQKKMGNREDGSKICFCTKMLSSSACTVKSFHYISVSRVGCLALCDCFIAKPFTSSPV